MRSLTGDLGLDCVFIAAGGSSNGPTELAVELVRDRGRVVDIGQTKLDLPWHDYYGKEIEFRFSRSYGPGRYDPNYEERGIDYPAGYVRWTERRNMAAFLNLVAAGQVQLDPIISAVHPFDQAEQVYQDLAEGKGGALGIVFEYPQVTGSDSRDAWARTPTSGGAAKPAAPVEGAVRMGVVGAGNYGLSVLLPNLTRLGPEVRLVEVATATSLSGANAARKFAFQRTSTDFRTMLAAPDIDAVCILTRHAAHAPMVAEGLRSGKAVFVEKPLAIDMAGLESVRQAVAESGNSRLLVGFNRRYSPFAKRIAEHFRGVHTPLVMHYRVHAGQMEADSWYLDENEGTRFAGEAGHFLDVLTFLAKARPVPSSPPACGQLKCGAMTWTTWRSPSPTKMARSATCST